MTSDVDYKLATLSILATRGETHVRDLSDAVAERLDMDVEGNTKKMFPLMYFRSVMTELCNDGSVNSVQKSAPPELDSGLTEITYYSITDAGHKKRSELMSGSRGDRVKDIPGYAEPANSLTALTLNL